MAENLLALQHLPCGSSFLPLWRPTQDPPVPRQYCASSSQLSPFAQLPVRQVPEHVPQDFPGGPATKKPPTRAGDIRATKPVHLEPMLCNKRSQGTEKPAHRSEEQPPLHHN